ncbi:MAG: NADPH-dependent assimilatory sulfite reductase hemoprotein subunit [Phycisphaeraceae bacterium]
MASKKKQTKVEEAKKNSHFLRGTIDQALHSDSPGFEQDDQQLLKNHGVYQQDDRDAREANKVLGGEREIIFMTRIKVPGGDLTPQQYLGMDKIAEELTLNRALRVTTRQNFQLHGVLKGTLKEAIKRVNQVMLSTLCGCGDVERNIMAPPAPFANPAHQAARGLAKQLSDALVPQTHAYHEIWLDGEKVDSSLDSEPLYGEQYLPRKFKTGIGLYDDNSTDVHSQDVGLIAILEGDEFKGVNILVGGGLGMTHKMEDTYARLGTPLGYAPAKHAIEVVRTIAEMFRDYGDRTDRKHARLKYIIEEQGIDAFREEFVSRVSFKLEPWQGNGHLAHQDWLGLHEQGDGRYFYGQYIANGRIMDTEVLRMKTAFRKIVEGLGPRVILTPNQNIIFGDLSEGDVEKLKRVVEAYNLPKVEGMSGVRRGAMACPALPTCGLALTEAERIIPEVLDDLEREFVRLELDEEPITVRMTGCPNGCARPYTADIGLVGHKPGHYDIFLGGRLAGDRLADLYAQNVPQADLVLVLRPVLEAWAHRRTPGQGLGDYYQQLVAHQVAPHILTGSKESPTRQTVEAKILSLPVIGPE